MACPDPTALAVHDQARMCLIQKGYMKSGIIQNDIRLGPAPKPPMCRLAHVLLAERPASTRRWPEAGQPGNSRGRFGAHAELLLYILMRERERERSMFKDSYLA